MAEPFCAKITCSVYRLFVAVPLAASCDPNMAEPFLRKNYLLYLSVFMAAPFADFAF
jgi:hypothetical protein